MISSIDNQDSMEIDYSIYNLFSYRSLVSQPNKIHKINKSETTRVNNSLSKNKIAIDCARCAAEYCGLGLNRYMLNLLQKDAVINKGTYFNEFDNWLKLNSRDKTNYLKLYALKPNYLNEYNNDIAYASCLFANLLLNEEEQIMSAYVRKYSSGHYFNIGKTRYNEKDIIWYIDPQAIINVNKCTLYCKIKLLSNKNNPIVNILFVLDIYQAKRLSNYVTPANYGNPNKGWWTKTD